MTSVAHYLTGEDIRNSVRHLHSRVDDFMRWSVLEQ